MSGTSRYDQLKKGPLPDYTDFAYKEAVSRLRSMMTDSYIPIHNKYSSHYNSGKVDDSDEESGVSITMSDTTRVAQLQGTFRKPSFQSKIVPVPKHTPSVPEMSHPAGSIMATPPEMMGFIERQEEYIEQLEKESQYCRDELSQLVGKVKDLIAENEALHEQQKSGPFNSAIADGFREPRKEPHSYDTLDSRLKPHFEGPNIVFESRISELEAQLTQARLEVKKAQEEVSTYKRKMLENDPTSSSSDFYRQIEVLHREKKELSDTLNRLQASTAQMRERESDASRKVLRTQDVAEKAQMDRQQAELEVQRLKSELEMQHERLLDVLSDQTRKVGEERSHAERRYLQHVEQLNNELALQRDSATKLQLELERHQRMEEDLRRDLSAKTATIETVRKELSTKIANLQNELTMVLTERDSFEQELNSSRMSGERTELVSKQESSRLQVEVNALRQRISKTDNELMQARRENLRLSEHIASQDKEITLYKIKIGEMELDEDGTPKKSDSVRELEGLVEKQSQAMSAITQQCQSLAQRLEDATIHHQQEMADLQTNLEFLTGRLETTISARQWHEGTPYEHQDEHYPQPVTYEEHPIDEPAPYQIEERQPSPSGNTSFQPQLHTLPETVLEDVPVFPVRPESRTGLPDKPTLSRSSSRGERSDSPLVRKDLRKSPLQRRESRLNMQQRTAPPEYAPSVQQEAEYAPSNYTENQYPSSSVNEEPYIEQGKFQTEYSNNEVQQLGGYEQPYRSQEQYNPEDLEHNTRAPQQYAPPDKYDYSEQYGGNMLPEDYGGTEPYHQNQDRQEVDMMRNRTPSRESLRSSHQGNPQGRQSSPQGYQAADHVRQSSPQGYQAHEQVRQRITSSNESLGPQPKYAPQENYDTNQHFQQSSPDQGRKQQQSSDYSMSNPPSSHIPEESQPYQESPNPRQQSNPVYEASGPEVNKASENQRPRQGPTLRREPSAISVKPQQKAQSKNLPTKFQS